MTGSHYVLLAYTIAGVVFITYAVSVWVRLRPHADTSDQPTGASS